MAMLGNLGAGAPASFADRFGQWSNTTTPSGRLPAWEPAGPTVPNMPINDEPGVAGYVPPLPQASGTSVPAPPEQQDLPPWAQFLANFNFRPARPAPQSPPFAFTGRPITLGQIGGQHHIGGLMRPPPQAGYG